MENVVTYEAMRKVLSAQVLEGQVLMETGNWEGRILVLKDNGETWFYFKDDILIHIRSY